MLGEPAPMGGIKQSWPRLTGDFGTVSADDQVKAYIKKIMSQLDRWMVGRQDQQAGHRRHRQGYGRARGALAVRCADPVRRRRRQELAVVQDQERCRRTRERVSIACLPACLPACLAWSPPTHRGKTDRQKKTMQVCNTNTRGGGKDRGPRSRPRSRPSSARSPPPSPSSPSWPATAPLMCSSTPTPTGDVPVEWGDSDAKEIENAERVQLRGFSTASHRVDTLVSYRLAD